MGKERSFSTSDVQAVVLAAGLGRRMKSRKPKVLHRLCGQTLIERCLRTVSCLDLARTIVVVGHGEEEVRAEIQRLVDAGVIAEEKLRVVLQPEQRGTGHAAQIGLSEADASLGLVLILPGDTPLLRKSTIERLWALCASSTPPVVAFLTGCPESPAGLGRIKRDKRGMVRGIVEDSDCTPEEAKIGEVNTSIYLAETKFLADALSTLNSNNAQGELYLTDIVSVAVNKGLPVEAVAAEDFSEVAGANSRAELSALEKKCRKQLNARFMEEGVTFEDPGQAYIDEDVQIGRDSYIGAGVRLQGRCRLGEGVVVEGETIIVDSSVGDESVVKLCCSVESSVIGKQCTVGPFAHLRPATVLADRVKIGNFVETKKAELEEGAKANHLTYIGDAMIGPDVNVGAGTITCNYDGVNKYQTIIGEGAFIGSNTSLIAPVKIGARAVIGAGSAVTEDVPDDSLGIERSEQRNVEGWARERRAKQGKS